MSRPIIALQVRLPPALWRKLTASAKRNYRSLNAEIVYLLTEAMEVKDE